jgi:hypothetical protein
MIYTSHRATNQILSDRVVAQKKMVLHINVLPGSVPAFKFSSNASDVGGREANRYADV